MSWPILVNGYFDFVPTIDNALRIQILNRANEVLECEPKQDSTERPFHYRVESLNWSSHVLAENIQQFYDEFRQYFTYFSLSYWDLSNATGDWYKES